MKKSEIIRLIHSFYQILVANYGTISYIFGNESARRTSLQSGAKTQPPAPELLYYDSSLNLRRGPGGRTYRGSGGNHTSLIDYY